MDGFFILLIVFLFFSGVILAPSINSIFGVEDKDEKIVWRLLAKSNDLRLIGGSYAGTYRGHWLRLSSSKDSAGIIECTYIILSIKYATLKEVQPDDALRQITNPNFEYSLEGSFGIESHHQQLFYEQSSVEEDLETLQYLFDLLCDLADAYYSVITLGGQAVSTLIIVATDHNHKLQPIATQLLKDISQNTQSRLADNASQLLCSNCLVRCALQKIQLSWWPTHIVFYGCRVCGQSQEFLEYPHIIAILDNEMEVEQIQQDEVLQVNSLKRSSLFDFEEVVIIKATDEEVEKFAVQVGNDTDLVRKPQYKQMCCKVSFGYQLSDNTIRVLQHMFGSVEIEDATV